MFNDLFLENNGEGTGLGSFNQPAYKTAPHSGPQNLPELTDEQFHAMR